MRHRGDPDKTRDKFTYGPERIIRRSLGNGLKIEIVRNVVAHGMCGK
jgi:hypothetical protein